MRTFEAIDIEEDFEFRDLLSFKVEIRCHRMYIDSRVLLKTCHLFKGYGTESNFVSSNYGASNRENREGVLNAIRLSRIDP